MRDEFVVVAAVDTAVIKIPGGVVTCSRSVSPDWAELTREGALARLLQILSQASIISCINLKKSLLNLPRVFPAVSVYASFFSHSGRRM